MEVITGTASNLVAGVVGYLFQKVKRNFSYVCRYRRMVSVFEKKVETLKDKRDGVLLDVDAAEKNGENIYPEVNSWLAKADKVTGSELKEVKGLENESKNKCFIGLCPNFKARYQLSKKAEEGAAAVDELLQQGGFDKVSHRDVPQPILFVPPKDFEDFDSRRLMFNNIMEAVKDPNVNIIGVHGMPGVGKTTLVREVVRQVKEDKLFDSVVMAVVTHTPDVQKIQDQIAEMLGLKFEEQSMIGRASRLCQRLMKEKILIVLDDIWAKLDLMEVGIPLGDEDQGCTILLTSRDLNVLLKDMDAKKSFPIGILEHEEAWHFFKKIIGDVVESSDLLPIATEVAKKCGGLPIAIRTLATFLRNEPPFVWEDALRQLSKPSSSNFKGVPATVYSTIEWSYDRLQSEDHKQTFLLCSLMGHNASLDLLLVFAMGLGLFHGVSTIKDTRNKLLTVVSHLKASCLLLDGYTNMHFDMHDLISDVAKSIASKGNPVFDLRRKHDLNDWPDDETMKECDKIVCAGMSELPDQLKCPKLTFLCMGSKDPWMKIPTTFFKETKNLKVLFLVGLNLPSSISLLGNLRVLWLVNCVLGDIALIGELKNLEILNIMSSDIEMLPKEIGQLTKLKRLDLRGCSKLKRIPPGVLCKLSRLEELNMDKDFDEWEADGHSSLQSNSSLAELKALSCLTALEIHISNAKIIPKDFFFEKLQRYIIFIGEASHWDWDWDWAWVQEYSRTLKLNLQTNISLLNNGVKVLLKKAENLYINEVKGVEILLHELEVGNYFQQLKNLHIQNGEMVQYILTESDAVQKIEFLELESLTLQGLPNLISFCSKKEGSTSISPQEISLFKQKILFPKLEKLKLSSISIGRIWSPQAFCSTQNLTSLIIKGCANLKHVLADSMPEYLQHLKCLEISECKYIREIISTDKMIQETFRSGALIRFPRLNLLKLKGLQKLIGFCHEDHTVEFPVLTILEIENCPELKGFIHNSTRKDIPTHGVLFNNKVLFLVQHIFRFSFSLFFFFCYS
ncbi:probable disease resistance protein At4g27220 [Gossypium arboreum]|uniref:probable disease resistance protein At4g27220 n=1 Tax=Gossypium arboreum TaxID=29729 RepID=UPI0022F1D4D5|nr:probable disease resistance protein At4g27220 [Gossypium arboreum]